MGNKNIVGLVLAYKGTNYGALLQAFATQVVVESLGVQTEILDYKSTNRFENFKLSYNFFVYYVNYKKQKRIEFLKSKEEQKCKEFVDNKEERKRISLEFRRRKLHNIRTIVGRKQLSKYVLDVCAFIVGSDQKWGPGACYGLIDSLRFVPSKVRRISYATSLGVSTYPKYCWNESRKMWKRIDYLSVREQQGANIIKDICGDIDVSVVLDPTYLISKEKWLELIPFEKKCSKKYIFCYFLGNDISQKECAMKYAKMKGLHLVSLLSSESLSKIDLSFADETVSGATPEDFINWIRGAECIFTDSFHGLAFSIINEKQLYIFYRKRGDVEQSRNSRIDNILETWKIESRLIRDTNIDWSAIKEENIDYRKIQDILEEKRRFSMDFLKKALTF